MNTTANIMQASIGAHHTDANNQDSQRESRNKTMLACVWKGKEDLAVEEVPVPELTDPEDAIVRITGTTVCGSDLHLYHGDILQLKSGDILGHEFMGIVEQVGTSVSRFKPGDRVVAAFNIACGRCEYCRKKLFTACEVTNDSSLQEKLYGHRISGILGYSHFVGGYAGGQAEYGRVLYADTNLIKIPLEVPDEKALYLSDVIPTSYHAIYEAGVQEGDIVGVWGLGPIGLNVVQWLRNVFKAKRIIVVDNVPARLRLAETHWGAEPVNFDEHKDVVQYIHELVPGGLDRIIDAAGFRYAKSMMHKVERAIGLETDTPEILNECIRSVKKFGTISMIADYSAYTNQFLIGAIMEKGIRLIGCGQAPIQRYWEKCLEFVEGGQFDPTVILTDRFELGSLPDIYKRFDEKDAGMIKVFIQTQFSNEPTVGTPMLSD